MGKWLNFIGQKFGRLTVIKRVEDKIYGKKEEKFSQWLCKCDCGNEIIVLGSNLRNGHTKSCGCWRKKVLNECNQLPLEEVKQEFINKGLIPLFDLYKNNQEKLLAKTQEGYKVLVRLGNLKGNRGWRIFDISNPYTIENIKLWLKLNDKPFELISDKYEGNKEKLQFRCKKKNCNEIFECSLLGIENINNCPCCVRKQIGISNCLATINPDLAKEWHPTKNGDLTPWDVAPNANKQVWWLCSNKDCNYEWEANINNRNRNKNCKEYGCKKCNIKKQAIKRSTPKFKKDSLLKNNPKLCKEWNYDKNDKGPECYKPKSHKEVWWKCSKCGYEWQSKISERNRKESSGCSKCNQSKGENKIEIWLSSKNILFRKQYRFKDCKDKRTLPFDFYLINYNILIEYDGLQHFKSIKRYGGEKGFKKRQRYDQIKNNYCILNKIKLYRIPYWEFDNIKKILDNIIHNQDYKEFLIKEGDYRSVI